MANAKTKGGLLCAYLIVGEDRLKRRRAMERLYLRTDEFGEASLNSDEFDAEFCHAQEVVMACNTLPFAAEKRLVHLYHAEKLKKHDIEVLVGYLSSAADTCVLAIEAERLAKSAPLYQAVCAMDPKAVIDCASPKKYSLPSLVQKMAVRCGIGLTSAASMKLIDLVGEDTLRLETEIKKIALAYPACVAIDETALSSLISKTSDVKPWEFVNAFSARDLAKCLRYLQAMPSVYYPSLLAMCTERIRELLCTQSLVRRRQRKNLASTLGLPEWRVKNHTVFAANFSSNELRQALYCACERERRMKSGGSPKEEFVDWLVSTLK